jgi:uncharacterized protein
VIGSPYVACPSLVGSKMRLSDSADSRTIVAAQLVAFILAAAMLIPAVTPNAAVTGGLWVKLAFLARVTALVALAHWMLRKRSLAWSDVGLTQPDWRRFGIAVPAGILLVMTFGTVAQAIITRAGLPLADYSMFAPIKGNLAEYLFWVLPVTIGTAAFGEELIFRGFVTVSLKRLLGGPGIGAVFTAVTAQAVIFGGLHFYQGVGGMITAGVTGLALGLTWLIAGRNLWAGIAIHALLDGSAMTAIYLGYSVT